MNSFRIIIPKDGSGCHKTISQSRLANLISWNAFRSPLTSFFEISNKLQLGILIDFCAQKEDGAVDRTLNRMLNVRVHNVLSSITFSIRSNVVYGA